MLVLSDFTLQLCPLFGYMHHGVCGHAGFMSGHCCDHVQGTNMAVFFPTSFLSMQDQKNT